MLFTYAEKFVLTGNADAYPEGIHKEGGKLSYCHVLTTHQQATFIQHTQDDHVATQARLHTYIQFKHCGLSITVQQSQ